MLSTVAMKLGDTHLFSSHISKRDNPATVHLDCQAEENQVPSLDPLLFTSDTNMDSPGHHAFSLVFPELPCSVYSAFCIQCWGKQMNSVFSNFAAFLQIS